MIDIRELCIRAGGFSREGISFSVPDGEYMALMGRTGSGKTTLLETLCGLRPAASGKVIINGVDCTDSHPADRGIGYVPQDGALFPTMTVREQLAFPLALRRCSKTEQAGRITSLAGQLGIEPLLERRPAGLSGGEVQRVALGRALIARPAVLLLDEPFSALDTPTREELYGLIEELREEHPITAVHVTHNANEAERLADAVTTLAQR